MHDVFVCDDDAQVMCSVLLIASDRLLRAHQHRGSLIVGLIYCRCYSDSLELLIRRHRRQGCDFP